MSKYKRWDFVTYTRGPRQLPQEGMINDIIRQPHYQFVQYIVTLLQDGRNVTASSLQLTESSLEFDFPVDEMQENVEIELVEDEIDDPPKPPHVEFVEDENDDLPKPTQVEFGEDENDDPPKTPHFEPPKAPEAKIRFPEVSKEEIVDLATRSHAKGTKTVTNWGVNVLKGN